MIRIIAVGKIKDSHLVSLIEDYKKKIKRKEKEIEEILSNIMDMFVTFLIIAFVVAGAVGVFGVLYVLLKIVVS